MRPNLRTPIQAFSDERGWFREISRESASEIHFKQTSLSFSRFGVLRGLHYQAAPRPIGRIVTCLSGEVFDVQVNLETGDWYGCYLKEYEQIYVPADYAHGFQVVSKSALIMYNTTEEFSTKDIYPECEQGILWNDPILNIDWPLENPILSERDKKWSLWTPPL